MRKDIATVFSFFFRTGIKSKRTKLFFIFSLIPAIIFVIFQIIKITNPESTLRLPLLYIRITFPFYFQLYIQILALFYGSTVLSDEIDNKTLIYLTTSPIKKSDILIGKFMAHLSISAIILTIGSLVTYIVANITALFNGDAISLLWSTTLIALLAVLAYSALFLLISSMVKKTILIGIFFIFGWEKAMQLFPGITQKLSIIHWIKSLLPTKLPQKGGFLSFNLEPSSIVESLIALILISIVAIVLACYFFQSKEFLLADSE